MPGKLVLDESVVKELTRALVCNNYRIYCDNVFTSVQLFRDLLYMPVELLDPIEKNIRRTLKPLLKHGLGERGSVQRQMGNLLCSLWQDNKTVSVLSTYCDPGHGTVLRRQRDSTRKSYTCPTNIIDYKQYMNGVDHDDQILHDTLKKP